MHIQQKRRQIEQKKQTEQREREKERNLSQTKMKRTYSSSIKFGARVQLLIMDYICVGIGINNKYYIYIWSESEKGAHNNI